MWDDNAAIAAAKAHQAIMDMAGAFRIAERQRIIELIESSCEAWHTTPTSCSCPYFIKLIKESANGIQ